MNTLSQRRSISSGVTFAMKLIFPFCWISCFAIATIALWAGGFHTSPEFDPNGKWIFTVVLIVGATFILKLTLPLKRVEIDGSRLFISNYFSDIAVNSDQIESVFETSRNVHPRRVVIRFKKETSFGREITFIPRNTFFRMGWKAHPIVAELRAFAALPESAPAGPEAPAALMRLPGFSGLRQWLGELYATDPAKLLKGHLWAAVLIGAFNALMLSLWFDRYAAMLGSRTLIAMAAVTFATATALILTSAIGLWVTGTQRRMLAIQSVVLCALALAVGAWGVQLVLVGLPRRGSFSWGPGLFEGMAGYAIFMVCRFLLPENAKDKALVFYLPILVAACMVPIDVGILIRFIQFASGIFDGSIRPQPG